MHICFIAIDYHTVGSGGGIASYVEAVGCYCVSQGHRVTILAKGRERKIKDVAGMRVIYVPLSNWHWYLYKMYIPSFIYLPVREWEWSLDLKKEIDRLLKDEKIDIFEGCETGSLFLGKGLVPLTVRLHGDAYSFLKHSFQRISIGERINRWLTGRVLKRASALSAPSRFHAQEMTTEQKWSEGRVSVIPNPINPEMLNEALKTTEDVSQDPKAPIVLYSGRIEYRKGTVSLLESAAFVAKTCSNVQYVIAGGHHSSLSDKDVKKIIDENNIHDCVQLLGHVPWKDLISWYQRASIFVMPSYYETFGISCIEAMAFGLPVVATTAGALPEVVEDGVTGILVPPGDAKALANAIGELLENPEKCKRMGAAGRARVFESFTVEKVSQQLLDFYQKVIEKNKTCVFS